MVAKVDGIITFVHGTTGKPRYLYYQLGTIEARRRAIRIGIGGAVQVINIIVYSPPVIP